MELPVFTALHWLLLVCSMLLSWRLFRDLADVSQWIVQAPREATIKTFRNRRRIVALWVLTIAVAWAVFYVSEPRFLVASLGVTLASTLLAFVGYINPRMMMRGQQDKARYFSVETAKKVLAPETSLIVMERNGMAYGHPDSDILRPHIASPAPKLVSQEPAITQDDVVMTYCGLTNIGMAFEPFINGQRLDLAPMTQLENNLVMWDRRTDEPIQQIYGRFESSGADEAGMPEWPSYRMPFWAFQRVFPNGRIFLNPIAHFIRNPIFSVYDRIMQLIFRSGAEHQASNPEPTFPTIRAFDDRLPNKARIYGINIDGDCVAYTKEFLRKSGGVVNAEIGREAIVIAYHEDVDSVGAYLNNTGHPIEQIDFGGDTPSGHLERVRTLKSEAFWVVWQNFFPEASINRSNSPEPEIKALA